MRIVVAENEAGRLDRLVAEHLGGRSRRDTRELLARAGVRVNGRAARKGELVRPGDVVDVDPDPHTEVTLVAQPELPLAVLLEDDALIAVDKPAGMPAVALRAGDRDTLANALLARFPELAAASRNPLEAGLVHRLDTGTSGVVLAARTRAAWTALRKQFSAGAIDKEYVALVVGTVADAGAVNAPIAHRPRRPREMCVCADGDQARALRARPAETRYRPLAQGRGTTLLSLRMRTGVRHQIRVHLQSIGHPIVGDALYGRDIGLGAPRLMLHAARIRARHPTSGAELEVVSPQPADFVAVLHRWRLSR